MSEQHENEISHAEQDARTDVFVPRSWLPDAQNHQFTPSTSQIPQNIEGSVDSSLITNISRRTLIKAGAGLAVGVPLLGRYAEASAAEINMEPYKFHTDFEVSPERQIEQVLENIEEFDKLPVEILHEIWKRVGTKVPNPNWGNATAPLLTITPELMPQFTLVKKGNEKSKFPNMCLDAFPITEGGGAYLTFNGLYAGRNSQDVETSIGKVKVDTGYTYRWLGGSKGEIKRIVEPSWYAWRKEGGVSNYTGLEETKGNFVTPQPVKLTSDTNGADLVKKTDIGIGSQSHQIVGGDAFAARDLSTEAMGKGYPGEFYSYDAVAAALTSATTHAEIYKLATLAQAHKEGFVMRVYDGKEFKNVPINEVYGDIEDMDINKRLEELPKYEDYLSTENTSLEKLFPLLRVQSVAVSTFL